MRSALAGILVLGLAVGCTATTTPRLVACRPLLHRDGPDPAVDRPAHVRSASGLAVLGDRLAIAEDDARFVALVGPAGVTALPLPPGPDGRRLHDDTRGTRALKLDLEAIVAVPDPAGRARLLAFGSGSTAAREVVAIVPAAGPPRVIEEAPLFAALRAEPRFAGAELNVEGAAVIGSRLRLFQRGNGAERDGRTPVNATADLELAPLLAHLEGGGPPPRPLAVTGHDLGEIDGARYGFTDATVVGGALLALAVAERSPDVTRDGEVVGARLGRWDGSSFVWSTIVEADGRPTTRKVEGIAPDRERPGDFLVVVDPDDPDRPSELCELHVGGHA